MVILERFKENQVIESGKQYLVGERLDVSTPVPSFKGVKLPGAYRRRDRWLLENARAIATHQQAIYMDLDRLTPGKLTTSDLDALCLLLEAPGTD